MLLIFLTAFHNSSDSASQRQPSLLIMLISMTSLLKPLPSFNLPRTPSPSARGSCHASPADKDRRVPSLSLSRLDFWPRSKRPTCLTLPAPSTHRLDKEEEGGLEIPLVATGGRPEIRSRCGPRTEWLAQWSAAGAERPQTPGFSVGLTGVEGVGGLRGKLSSSFRPSQGWPLSKLPLTGNEHPTSLLSSVYTFPNPRGPSVCSKAWLHPYTSLYRVGRQYVRASLR